MTSADFINRRTFLRNATGLALGASAANAIFDLRLMQTALAQSGGVYPDYKALVCVFLNGGNDGNNLVIPFDDGAGSLYKAYSDVRGGALGLFRAAPTGTIQNGNTYYGLPLSTLRTGGEQAAVHSSMEGMQTLFDAGKAAFVRNVGVLTEPLTRAEFRNNKKKKPPQLFSHNDQVTQWQTSLPDLISRTGWGGRLMDRVRLDFAQQSIDPGQISMSVSISGTNTWEVGEVVNQFKITGSGASTFQAYAGASNTARRTLIDQLLRDPSKGGDAALNATRSNLGMQDFRNINERTLLNGSALTEAVKTENLPAGTNDAITAAFLGNNTGLASQLKMVAKIIAARTRLGMRRQLFFCSIGGFDTHGLQPAAHAALLSEVSRGMKALYDATASAAFNVADKVTSFTAADFGRTFKSNGEGTDHAWGNNHIVVGGAVQGGKLYGTFPNFVLGGPNDTDSGSGATGRWIPTTSVDEYSATLARWFGVTESALDVIFPNLRRFPNRNLGIMG